MAQPKLVNCPVCGSPVSDHAPACPKCGDATAARFGFTAPVKKKPAGCGTLVGVVFLGVIVIGAVGQCTRSQNGDVTPDQTSHNPASPAAPVAKDPPKLGSQWNYATSPDEMSSKPAKYASVTSTNSLSFDSPYEGLQHATLMLRRHPRYGDDVIFSIEKGQLMCSSYSCSMKIRYDDQPARTINGNEPEDRSSEMVFLQNYAAIAPKIAKARKLRIEFSVFQEGTQVAEFDVSGLDLNKLK